MRPDGTVCRQPDGTVCAGTHLCPAVLINSSTGVAYPSIRSDRSVHLSVGSRIVQGRVSNPSKRGT